MNSFDGDRSDVDFDLTDSGSRRNRGRSSRAIFIDDDDNDDDFQPEALPPTRQSSTAGGSQTKKDVRHMSEEEMLEAAIRASLEDDGATPASDKSGVNVEDESSEEDEEEPEEEQEQHTLIKKRKSDVLSTPEPTLEESNAKRAKIDSHHNSSPAPRSNFPEPQAEDQSRGSKDCTIQIRLPTGSTLTVRSHSMQSRFCPPRSQHILSVSIQPFAETILLV